VLYQAEPLPDRWLTAAAREGGRSVNLNSITFCGLVFALDGFTFAA